MSTEDPVVRTIQTYFDRPVSVEPVTSSVYKLDSQHPLELQYAKRWSPKRQSILETLVEIDTEIGMPRSEVVSGDACVQLMGAAPGRKLSTVLALRLLPGVWRRARSRMIEIFRDFGRKIGRLHVQTSVDPESLDISNLHLDKYDAIRDCVLAPALQDRLDERTVHGINSQLERYTDRSVRTAIVHGDLMLFHAYVAGEKVSIIDFDRAWRAHPLEDIATLLCALDLFVRRLPYGRQSQYEKLFGAVMDEYKKTTRIELDSDLLRLLKTVRDCSILLYYLKELDEKDSPKVKLLKNLDSKLLLKMVRGC